MLLRSSLLCCLLLSAVACSTTTIRPTPPPLGPLLRPDPIEGKYASIELLKADPTSDGGDLHEFAHQCEATVRRANRDQVDAWWLLQPTATCPVWRRLFGGCQ